MKINLGSCTESKQKTLRIGREKKQKNFHRENRKEKWRKSDEVRDAASRELRTLFNIIKRLREHS